MTTFIEFDQKYKIEKACSNDIMRYNMTKPFYKDGVLKATDGHILVHLYLDKNKTNIPDGPIDPELIKRGRRNTHGTTVKLNQNDSGMIRHSGEPVWFERDTEEKFGKYPNTDTALNPAKGSPGKHKLAINPQLLLRLAEAMGSPTSVILHIGENYKDLQGNDECTHDPIYVQVHGDPDVEGVIMPMQQSVPETPRSSAAPSAAPAATPEPAKVEIDI